MAQQEVGNMALLTGQEHIFMGSTPEIIPPVGSNEWYIPQGILMGSHTVEAVLLARAEKGYMKNPVIGAAIGAKRNKDEIIGFKLAEIDRESGITKQDPQMTVGKWDPEGRQLIGQDVTRSFLIFHEGMPEEDRIYIPMRSDISRQPEGGRGHPERG